MLQAVTLSTIQNIFLFKFLICRIEITKVLNWEGGLEELAKSIY